MACSVADVALVLAVATAVARMPIAFMMSLGCVMSWEIMVAACCCASLGGGVESLWPSWAGVVSSKSSFCVVVSVAGCGATDVSRVMVPGEILRGIVPCRALECLARLVVVGVPIGGGWCPSCVVFVFLCSLALLFSGLLRLRLEANATDLTFKNLWTCVAT